VISSVTGLFVTVIARKTSAQLDASTGASGPHDFTVRNKRFARRFAPDAVTATASHTQRS
jgi:hypothetical protein